MKKALIAIAVLGVLIVGGTWVYINFIKGDAPEPLALTTSESTTGEALTTIDGTWEPGKGSQVGYRVQEVLFGQETEAVGRTPDVTGEVVIAGTQVTSASFTANMKTVKSDEDRRDSQFNGRIMETEQFPTATFELSEPLSLGEKVPAPNTPVTVTAKGKLTLHGVTNDVTIELKCQLVGSTIEVNSNIPIVFADYGIDNPSFGPAQTEDNGTLEVLLKLNQK